MMTAQPARQQLNVMAEPVDGVYSWSLNMAGITGDNGTVEICPDDLELGDNTLMVVDTANEDAEDTETLTLEECGPTECAIDVIADSLCRSPTGTVIPAAFRIEAIGIDPLNILTTCYHRSVMRTEVVPSVSVRCCKRGKPYCPNFGTNTTVILQTVLVWPCLDEPKAWR